jgi:hypothetical protein
VGEAGQRTLEQPATRNSFIEMTRGAFTQGGRPQPATAGRRLANRIPGSSYTLWPNHGHVTWGDSDEVIDTFTAITLEATTGEQS